MKRRSNIWTVAKKELDRFFGDKRVVFSTVILPGLLIYAIYSFMGTAISDRFNADENHVAIVYTVNAPESFKVMTAGGGFELTEVGAEGEIIYAKDAIANKNLDILAVFPENFDEAVAAYETSSGSPAPQVELFYNSTNTESSAAYQTLYMLFDLYESALANKYDINLGAEEFDLATEKDATGFVFASMLPMLMMMFLFQSCMGVAPEAIAGEKERGTIATMLITPMRRSELATGKIISIAIIAVLGGASSTIGTLLSVPSLMGAHGTVGASFYTVSDYLLLAAVALSTVLLFVSVISIISAYAKSVKEAATSATPLMIIAMVVGVSGMLSSGAQTEFFYYLIPMYNTVQSMVAIFSFTANTVNIITTVGTNLAIAIICGFVLTKMFNSEKCMFNK